MMQRNKKFYRDKELRRLSEKLDELQGYNIPLSQRIKNRDQYGRWNGYEFYLSVKKEAKKHYFRRDLWEVLNYCSKTFVQVPGGYYQQFTEESCKIFKGTIADFLLVFGSKEHFESKIPYKYRYLFDYEKTWTWDQDIDVSGWRKTSWHLADRYTTFLEVHRRKGWEPSWNKPPSSEVERLRNKIDRDNLWPKINRAFGVKNRHTWDKIEKKNQDLKLKRITLKETEEKIADLQSLSFIRRYNGQITQVYRDWKRFLTSEFSEQYYNGSREQAALIGCGGIFTIDPKRTRSRGLFRNRS